MIKGLITSLLVSMGVVSPTTNTPSFIHNQQENIQIKRQNDNDFELVIDSLLQSKQYTNDHVSLGYYSNTIFDSATYYMESFDYQHAVSNNYLNIREQETIQQTWAYLTPNDPYINNPFPLHDYYLIAQDPTIQTFQGKQLINNLTILQLTPYRWTDNNTLTLNYRVMIDERLEGNNLITKMYISNENTLSTYMNRNSWATAYGNQQIYETITSAEFGYNYDLQTYTTEIDDHLFADITTEITIASSRTTYIFLYNYLQTTPNQYALYGETTNGGYLHDDPCLELQGSKITGTYIPPINNVEVVDIPGLMFTILTMPFSFISTAFNLTLFPGTPYQINISELFLGILGLLIFVWIIKKIIEAKTGGL